MNEELDQDLDFSVSPDASNEEVMSELRYYESARMAKRQAREQARAEKERRKEEQARAYQEVVSLNERQRQRRYQDRRDHQTQYLQDVFNTTQENKYDPLAVASRQLNQTVPEEERGDTDYLGNKRKGKELTHAEIEQDNQTLYALSLLRFTQANAEQLAQKSGTNNPLLERYEQQLKQYEVANHTTLNAEQSRKLLSNIITDEWHKVIDKDGAIKKELLTDKAFVDNVDPNTYKRMASHRYTIDNQDSWQIWRNLQQGYYDLKSSLDYVSDGDTEAYRQRQQKIDSLSSNTDWDLMADVSRMLGNMGASLVTGDAVNVGIDLLGLSLAPITYGTSIKYAMGANMFFNSSRQQLAQAMEDYAGYVEAQYRIDNDGKEISQEELQQKVKEFQYSPTALLGATLSGALDTTALTFSYGLAKGGIKGLMGAAEQGAQRGATESLMQRTAEMLTLGKSNIAKGLGQYGAHVTLGSTAEISTEVIQDMITKSSVDFYIGKDRKEFLDDLWEQAGETFDSASLPILLLTALTGAPRLYVRGRNNARQQQELAGALINSVQEQTTRDIASVVRQSMLNGTSQQSVTVTRDTINLIQEREGTLQHIDPDVVEQFQNTEVGGTVTLTRQQYDDMVKTFSDKTLEDTILADRTIIGESGMTAQQMRESFDEERIERNREELGEEFARVQENITQREKIEAQITRQLMDMNVADPKQQTAIAKSVTSFYQAMAKILDTSIEDVANKYGLDYIFVDRENWSDELSEIDIKNRITDRGIETVHGIYNVDREGNRRVLLNDTADFSTVFHETAHHFLQVIKELSATNEKARQIFDDLIKFAFDENTNSTNITEKQFSDLQEMFVANFIAQTLEGRATPITKNLKSLLGAIGNANLLGDAFRRSGKTKGQFIRDTFGSTYTDAFIDKMNGDNTAFDKVLDAMFDAQIEQAEVEEEFNSGTFEEALDKSNLSEADKAIWNELKQQYEKTIQQAKDKVEGLISQRNLEEALIRASSSRKLVEFLKKLGYNFSELGTSRANKTVVEFIERIKEAHEKFNKLRKDLLEKLKKTPEYQFYLQTRDNLSFNINESMGFSAKEIESLRKQGLVNRKGAILNATDILQNKELPESFREYINEQTTLQGKIRALVELLKHTKNVEHTARDLALQQTAKTFDKYLVKRYEQVIRSQNTLRKRMANLTLKYFDKILGDKQSYRDDVAMLEELAEHDVFTTPYENLNERKHRRNAKRAEHLAQQALMRGDIVEAKKQTHIQIYQTHMADTILTLQRQTQNRMNRIKKTVERGYDKLAQQKKYDIPLLDLAKTLAYRVGITRRVPRANEETIREHIDNNYSMLDKVLHNFADFVYKNDLAVGDINSRNVGDVLLVLDNLESILGLSKKAYEIKLFGQRKVLSDLVNEALVTLKKKKDKLGDIYTDANGNNFARINEQKGFWNTTKRATRYLYSYIVTPEKALQRLDGKMVGGVFHEMLYRLPQQGRINFQLENQKYLSRVQKAFEKVKFVHGTVVTINEFDSKDAEGNRLSGRVIGENGQSVTEELMGIMAHMGTNMERFLNAYIADDPNLGYKENMIMKQRKFEQFFNRMIQEGYITEEMIDCMQEVWNIGEELGEQVNRTAIGLNGKPFEKLKGKTYIVKLKNGKTKTIHAKYMPALTNQSFGQAERLKQPDLGDEIRGIINNQNEMSAAQNPRFVQERKKGVDIPLNVNITELMNALITEELKYIHIVPPVTQAWNFLENKEVAKQMDRVAPELRRNVIKPYLENLAGMKGAQGGNILTRIAGKIFARGQMGAMFMNLGNTIQQTANIPLLLGSGRASLTDFVTALTLASTDYNTMRNKIMAESKYMETRLSEVNNRMEVLQEQFNIDPKNFDGGFKKAWATVTMGNLITERHAYFLQTYFQRYLDVVGYLAIKRKAERMVLDGTLKEEEMIPYVESTLRSAYGSMDMEDLPKLAKSNVFLKAFSAFTNYFIQMTQNYWTDLVMINKSNGTNFQKSMGYLFSTINHAWIVPVLGELIMSMFATGDWWHDDDEGEFNYILLGGASLSHFAGNIPAVNHLVRAQIEELYGRKRFYQSLVTAPSATVMSSGYSALENLVKAVLSDEKELKGREVKSIIQMMSLIFNIPIGFIAGKEAGIAFDYHKDRIEFDNSIDAIRAFIMGRAGEHTKK